MLSVPLVLGGRVLGAMKVYARDPGVFTVADEGTLTLLAGAVAVLLGCAQSVEAPQRLSRSLQGALDDRQVVGVAVGLLMERHGTDARAARAALLEEALLQGRTLAQVASQLAVPPASPGC